MANKLIECHQALDWKHPLQYERISTNALGPFSVKVVICDLNSKEFSCNGSYKTLKEAEHNAALVALKFLRDDYTEDATLTVPVLLEEPDLPE